MPDLMGDRSTQSMDKGLAFHRPNSRKKPLRVDRSIREGGVLSYIPHRPQEKEKAEDEV